MLSSWVCVHRPVTETPGSGQVIVRPVWACFPSLILFLKISSFLYFNVCMCTTCVLGAPTGQRRSLDPLELSYRWLWTTMRVLGKRGSSGRRATALSPEPPLQPPRPCLCAAFWPRCSSVVEDLPSVQGQCCKRKRGGCSWVHEDPRQRALCSSPGVYLWTPAQSALPEVAPVLSSGPGHSLEACRLLHDALGQERGRSATTFPDTCSTFRNTCPGLM